MGSVIKDIVHGYINIDEDDLKTFIDTPIFQRSKRIRHLTAHEVYPCANHTRFEHSIGVMHLGIRALNILIDKSKSDTRLSNFLNENKVTLKYSCLLHDIGQFPFSHTFEEEFSDRTDLAKLLFSTLKKDFKIELPIEDLANAQPHEIMGCRVALHFFGPQLQSRGVNIELFCRSILGITYEPFSDKKDANIIIGIVNSYMDVDKLDYLLRDTVMTGAQLCSIDTERLLNAYEVNKNQLVFSSKALSVIRNFIYGRDMLYEWVYCHHIAAYWASLMKQYVQHLININKIRREEFFSFSAITEHYVDDIDLSYKLKSFRNEDNVCQNFAKQIFDRQYLEPLWKTHFHFARIENGLRDGIIEACYSRTPIGLQTFLQEELEKSENIINKGDIIVAMTSLKPFSPKVGKKIYLEIDGENIDFSRFFHITTLKGDFKEIPYIFTKPEFTKKLENLLKQIS